MKLIVLGLFLATGWLQAAEATTAPVQEKRRFNADLYDPNCAQMNAIAQDPKLSLEEKIARLKAFGEAHPGYAVTALWHLHQLSPERAVAIAQDWFRTPAAETQRRLVVGKWLLTRTSLRDKVVPEPGFAEEYGTWLVQAAIDDNGDSFMKVNDGMAETAVGQLACWAAGFNGFSDKTFPKNPDRKIVPILIRSLGAPDDVWPENQGCVIRGKPGESTGRNCSRQNLPIALARLQAVEAVPDLERTMRTHHDLYLKMNSAYALGLMADEPKRRAMERELVESAERGWCGKIFQGEGIPDAKHLVFPFAKGLLARNDLAGIAYLGPEWYSEGSDVRPAADRLYWLETRIVLTRDLRDPKLATFFRTALTDPVLANVWRLDKKVLAKDKYLADLWRIENSRKNWESQLLQTFSELLRQIQANHLTELAPEIQAIADTTASPELAAAAREALKAWPAPAQKTQ